jgi:hypothetical protein
MALNEQTKNNEFFGNYEMVMNLAHVMLAGCSLDDFLNKRRTQEVNNLTGLAKKATELTL